MAVGECTRGRGKRGGRAPTLLAAAVAAVFSFGGTAQAACSAGPDTFTCSGAELITRTLSGTPLNVTLDPTFSMNAAGNGLVLTGTNGLSVTQDANGGSLAAQGTAVDARNTGGGGTGVQVLLNGNISGSLGVITQNATGPTTINVTGTITVTGTGPYNRGIYATSGVAATDMRITTADVIGGSRGVWTFNQGVGSLTIDTTAGSVQGATVAGVWGQNWSLTNTFMTITTADVYGGEFGITTNQNGTGSLTIDSTLGTVTGVAKTGIGGYIYNTASTGNLTITTADVNSNDKGIWAYQAGTGATVINTTLGTVTSANATGILAEMLTGSGDLTITTADVSGGQYGIRALHNGTGSTNINTTGGTVTTTIGSNYYSAAIVARTSATSTNLTITTAGVNGARSGIRAYNLGTGLTKIDTTRGTVTGDDLDGVFAKNGNTTTDLTITTANVSADQYGVRASNYGTGSTVIDTTLGSITANSGDGVSAFINHTAGNLTITTADVFGGTSGMVVYNWGNGSTTIDTTRGSVSGVAFQGINAQNDPSATDLAITTADVTGVREGILARNSGTGSTTIDTTAGTVTGGTNGVNAEVGATANSLSITTANVSGGTDGIRAINAGTGATIVNTTAGSVTGTTVSGINATLSNAASAADLTLTTASVSGGQFGIQTNNAGTGTGATAITVAPGGLVQGGTAGISATHASANPFTITIDGQVRNASGLATDLALTAASSGRGLTLQNNSNTIIGTVNLTAAADTFNNVGSWFTENGTSDFGAGNDTLNNSGLIRAANNAALAETTRFNNLEQINHSGLVTLQDGAVGDRLVTSGNFTGSNGEIRLDTILDNGAGGSDILEIGGNAAGSARLRIANAGGAGTKTTGDGILVVQVNGTSTNNAFSLAAPLKVGIWDYQLDYGGANNNNQNWYLVNRINEVGALYESTPRILLAALQSIPTLQQRVGQRQVYGQPDQQGAWLRIISEGSDATAKNSSADSRWDSQTRSLQGGYEHLLKQSDQGDLVIGLSGHYRQLDADIHNAAGRAKLDGESYGAGLTLTWYGLQGSYVDLQAVASRNSLDFASASLGTLAKDRHGSALTLSAEAGHRLALDERHTLIPQIQWQGTRLKQDDFTDQQGNRAALGDQTSHLARVGLAWEYRSERNDRFYVIGNLLHDFTPQTDVRVNGTRLQAESYRNAAEIGFGGTLALNSSAAFYGEGNYRRNLDSGGDSDGYLLTAGVRVSW